MLTRKANLHAGWVEGNTEKGDGQSLHRPIGKDLGDILLTAAARLMKQLLKCLVDTGAQISALTKQDAATCGVGPSKWSLLIVHALGVPQSTDTAAVSLIIPGEETRFFFFQLSWQ